MKKKDVTANAPVSLVKYINQKHVGIVATEKKQKENEKLTEENRRRREEKNLREGLDCAKKIWHWVEEMRQSDLGKKMIRLSHVPTAYRLVVFWDGYEPGTTRWFSLAFYEDGLMRPHYGRMFGYTKFNSADELAKSFPPEILEKICVVIDDGSVWKRIEKGFKQKEGL